MGYVLYVEPWNGSLNVSFSHVRVEGKKGGYQERGQSEEGDGMEVQGGKRTVRLDECADMYQSLGWPPPASGSGLAQRAGRRPRSMAQRGRSAFCTCGRSTSGGRSYRCGS